MREIKYQAYVKLNPTGRCQMFDVKGIDWEHNRIKTAFGEYPLVGNVLRQYTGLKDINGNPIYDGDILTSCQYPFQDEGKYNYHGIVEWVDEHASFFLAKCLANPNKRGISDGISEAFMEYEMTDFEVIGNIHENPELLGASAKEASSMTSG